MTIEQLVSKAIEDQTAKIIEEEIEAASERVKKRVKERTGAIAASVLSQFSMERIGPDLLIRVKFEDRKRTEP